jgi:predicted CoA-binding protein
MNETIKKILSNYKTIAVVGLSDKPERPSFRVAKYLKENGYKIIPVNPNVEEVLGEKNYPDLASIPFEVEVVDIFRRSEEVLLIVKDAIKIGAKAIWMQEGVVNLDAKNLAEKSGLLVVMNACMLKEHMKIE